jgi:two-component system, cell cycle sensor histidine kinase and response regulator CckA
VLNEHDSSRLAELEKRCEQLEKDLRLNEDRFNKLFQASSNLMTITTVKDGRIIDINEASAGLGGYTREELIGQVSAEMGLFADAKQREMMIRELREDGKVHNLEMKVLTKSGGLRTILLSADPIIVKEEPCVLAIAIDITEREQADEALRQAEQKYRSIFENALEGMFRSTSNGKFLMVNPALAKMLGFPSSEKVIACIENIGRELFVDPGERKKFMRQLQEHDVVRSFEFESHRKDGSRIWLSIYCQAFRDSAGNLLYYEGYVEDITKRKQVDESLRQTLAWQAALFEGSRDGILISDKNAKIVAANAAACKLTGYSKQELLKMQASDLQTNADLPMLADLHNRILAGEDIQGETIITTKDGRSVDVEFGHQRVLISGVPYVHTIARDVSSRKLLEAQLLQAQKMEAIGALAGGVAHDFNNLLSVIKGYTELLLDGFDRSDPRCQDLEQIEKAAQRAVSLTSQLLAFSRKQILQPEILDLDTAIADMSTMLRRLIGEDIELITLAQPNLGLIYTDPGQIQQIVMNLTVNARDAMPQGGKLIIEAANVDLDERSVRTRPMMEKGSYVLLAISDNGIGMDAATRSRVFEPFFTTKEKGKGTGLGLSTVYGIVKQSNGFIWVYSEPGKGTTFKIYFPRVRGEVDHAASAGKLKHEDEGSETVLLVEDEKSVRALAGRILRERGYNVLQAGDGIEALRVARDFNGDIDLVLTDVVMPSISGRTLVARLESMRPGIKSLYMSGYTDTAIVDHGILDSKVAFLQKPFTVQSLAHRVREVINSR